MLICSFGVPVGTIITLICSDSITSSAPLPESTVHEKSGTGAPQAVQLSETLLRYSVVISAGPAVIAAGAVRGQREKQTSLQMDTSIRGVPMHRCIIIIYSCCCRSAYAIDHAPTDAGGACKTSSQRTRARTTRDHTILIPIQFLLPSLPYQ